MAKPLTFTSEGVHWMSQTVTEEENADFRWLNVVAVWCGYGLMPLWHREPRRFLLHRRRKSDGSLVNAH